MKLLNLGIIFTIPMFRSLRHPIQRATNRILPREQREIRHRHGDSTRGSNHAPHTVNPHGEDYPAHARMIEPDDLLFSAAGTGIDQLRHIPPAWGEDAGGYADRFGSAEGYVAAHNAIAAGFGHRSSSRSSLSPYAGRPVQGAAVECGQPNLLANKDSGGRMINVSELAGNFGAGFVANTWEPNGYNSPTNGLERER